MTEPTLVFIAKQNERILTEISAMRDELRVQGAILTRVVSLLRDAGFVKTRRSRHDSA